MVEKFLVAAACTVVAVAPLQAAQVDLTGWTAEGGGNWVVQPGNDSVLQTVNGLPTVFYSDFTAFGRELAGTIRVNTSGDDDFIGFVVGYNPGDLASASTDFIVIDWKQGNQGAFGCSADRGIAVSRATAGLGDNAGAWCHQGNGVTELARGATLGDTGWSDFTTYNFSIEYTATNLKLYVDDVLQADLNGTFSNGRFGFYNYSQATVLYAGITQDVIPGGVPEPATWAMLILGFGAVGGAMRRKGLAKLSYA